MTVNRIVFSAALALALSGYGSAWARGFCVDQISEDTASKALPQAYIDSRRRADFLTQSIGIDLVSTGIHLQLEPDVTLVSTTDGRSEQRLEPIKSGYDFRGWKALSPVGRSWLYAEGAEVDTAFHLQQTEQGWAIDRKIRIGGHLDTTTAVMSWLTGWKNQRIREEGLESFLEIGGLPLAPVPAISEIRRCSRDVPCSLRTSSRSTARCPINH